MRKLSILLIGLLLLSLFSTCTSVKRFKSATYKSVDNTLVDMELFGSMLVPEGIEMVGRNLWDLSAGAQTQLIQILNERYPDNRQFMGSLGNEYLGDGGVVPENYTRKELRMVFTISRQRDFTTLNNSSSRFSPADRIEYLSFSLEIPQSYNLVFTGWNRFTTEYGEVEIADVSFSRSIDLDADLTGLSRTDLGAKGSLGRDETQEVRSRYLKLNGSISDYRIGVEEEGTREIDLTGNVIADVSLEFKGFPERITIPVFAGRDQAGAGIREVIALQFMDVLVPRIEEAPDTIKGLLQLDFIYRHVQSGWKTFQEWDDQVEYYSGTIKKEVPLFTKSGYLPGLYTIGTEPGPGDAIKVRTAAGRVYPLQFRNYMDASRFLDWLDAIPGKYGLGVAAPGDSDSGGLVRIGKNTLMFRGEPMASGESTNLGLKVIPVNK